MRFLAHQAPCLKSVLPLFSFVAVFEGFISCIFLLFCFVLIPARVCAPPYAAVRGGVPAVRLPLDEQPPDEGAAAAVHDQTVGHVSGAITHRARRYHVWGFFLALQEILGFRNYSPTTTSVFFFSPLPKDKTAI